MANSCSHSRYMDEVCPGLFLGGRAALATQSGKALLAELSITHVLSVESMKPDLGSLDVEHKFVCINDLPDADILQHFEECIGFIEEALANGRIFVHCMMGISRSSTIVTAYLMHRDKITFKDAFEIVQKKHPMAEPNYGFVNLLCLFEAMGCQFSPSDPLYRQHRLGQLAGDIQAGQKLPAEMVAADPHQETITDETTTIYKCRKCRRAVFLESSLLSHITGKGQASFQWHKQSSPQGLSTPPAGTMNSSASCTSLFVEPVKWMEPLMIGELEGKLSCPKCNARLGSFKWAGLQCSCGAWVTPAFQIHQNRVDRTTKRLPATRLPAKE